MKVKTISKEELEEKKEAAAESHELKPGTKIRILKVSRGKSGLNMEIEKTVCRMFKNAKGDDELREFTNISKENHMFIPHNDLMLAFDLLRAHLLIITEQREAYDEFGNVLEPSVLDSYEEEESPLSKVKVNSFDISSGYGISLSGTKTVRRNHLLPLSTDNVYFEGFDEDEYLFGDELMHVAKHLQDECLAYYNGKYMPDAQMKIEYPEETSEEASF